MQRYIMSITARDRSGIVAGVSEALVEVGGNIEAASQTVHQGYFAMIVLAAVEGKVTEEAIAAKVREKAGEHLHVYVTVYEPGETKAAEKGQSFMVTSVGPDRPGILHRLTSYLADKEINVEDLYCFVDTEGEFVVICQVSLAADMDVFILQADLEAVGEEVGFTVHLQHENIFRATNDLVL